MDPSSSAGCATRRPRSAPDQLVLSASEGDAGSAERFHSDISPTLGEKNIVLEVRRIPSTALSLSQAMQIGIEGAVSRLPQGAVVFSRTGRPDIAADRMPPNASDTYFILKSRTSRPPDLPEELIRQIDAETNKLVGNNISFLQADPDAFQELIAGVREDFTVMVFRDECEPMLRAENRIATILRGIDGAADVSVEQATGLRFLEIKVGRPGSPASA